MSSSWLFFALVCLLAMHAESKDCTSTGTQVHVYFQQSGVILPDEAKDSIRDAVAQEMGMATTDFRYEVTSNKVVLIFAGAEAVEKAAALQDKVENQYKGAWNPVEGFPVGMVKIEEQYSCKDAVVGTSAPKKISVGAKPTEAPVPVDIEEPTANPTELVTRAPTDEPTAEPTSEPTELMTAFPTQVTPAPSELPTRDPTATPTELPSAEPSHTPSYEPTTLDPTTVEPTAEPTAEPTYHPSHTPTEVPTTKPPTTDDPSFAPTHTPTEGPTLSPTHTPTFEPTEAPTTLPPTEYPTTPPTESPTENPTSEPSAGPTESPTELPTHAPTRDPTEVPTTKPPTTDSPSEAPTHTPTKDPTEVPTHTPTEVPTPSPTDTPTEVPTPAPTTYPTREPTTEDPTSYPTSEPTTLSPTTTDEPSFSPTYTPTEEPTTQPPTPQPTEVPTAYPSWAKTITPTETPSVGPTAEGTPWAGTLAPTQRPTFAPVVQETCPSTKGCPQDCSCKGTCTQNVLVSYVDTCFATYQKCTSIAATCETNMRNCLAAGALEGFTCACNPGYAGTACQLPAPTCDGSGGPGTLVCGGGTGTSFGVSTVNGVETGACKCGTGYTLDPVSKCCKQDTIVVSTATCSSSAAPTAAPGIARSTCLNGGVYENGACSCFGAWNGPNCQYPGLPVGWEIEPPSACNGLPLVSTDMPLQSTWVRMMTAEEDNVVTFKPWKESKLEILKDIVIGLDQPYVMAGSDLQSGPAGAGDTLSGSGVISAWIGFANTSFVVRASILAQMSLGASSFDAYSASAGRRLLSKARAHLRDDERAAMEAYDMAHSYGGAAGASMAMGALAIRIDMPLGLSIGTIDKRYCEYEAYLPRLSNVALYLSTGDLSDKQLALLPGGGLGGLQVKQGITIMAEYYINGCALPGLNNIVRDATTLFMATVALPPQFGITLTSQTALRFSAGSPIIGGAASLTFSVVGSLMEEEAQALLQVGCPGIKSYVETKGKIAVWLGRDANGNAAQVEFQATTYIGTQTCPVLAAPMRIQGDMIGCWNNPLGIKGFSLCDVGLGIGVNALLIPSPAAFDYFRVQAGLVIGSTKWAIKVVVDVSNPLNSAILGALNGTVCLSDIFNFPLVLARNAGLDVPLIPAYFVPTACMADIVLKASLSKIVIAGDTYDAGIQMSGKITLLSTTFSFLFRIAFIELRIMATATKIEFGPLTIGGLGCDMIANTADDGPCLDAMFKAHPSPFTAYFKFTGLFSVTSFFSVSTDLVLDQNGLMLKFSTTLVIATADFEIFTTQKGDDSSKGQIVDFGVKFEYTNAGWAYLGNMMLQGLKQWEADINAAIKKANDELAAAAVKAGDECRNALGVPSGEEATAYVQLETLSKAQREEIISQRIMGSIHRIAVAAGYKHCPKTNGTRDEDCVDVTHIDFAALAKLIKIAEEKGHFAEEVAMPKAPTAPKMDAKKAFAPTSRRLLAKVEADEVSGLTIPETNGAAVNALQTGAKTKWHIHHRHHNHHWHHSHHSHHWHHDHHRWHVHHSHHSHHIHIPHNHHWHHRHHRHHFHLAAIVSTVTNAVTNAVNVVYNAVAGALCNLGQAFMDSVVRTVVVGAMEVGKTVLITAGKVVAQGIATIGGAIDKVFSVQRIYYAGSLAAAAMGNFGTLEIDLTVFSTQVNLKVVFDIVGMIKALGTAVKDAVAKAIAIFK